MTTTLTVNQGEGLCAYCWHPSHAGDCKAEAEEGVKCRCDGHTQWFLVMSATIEDAEAKLEKILDAGYEVYCFMDGTNTILSEDGRWALLAWSKKMPPCATREEWEKRVGVASELEEPTIG